MTKPNVYEPSLWKAHKNGANTVGANRVNYLISYYMYLDSILLQDKFEDSEFLGMRLIIFI